MIGELLGGVGTLLVGAVAAWNAWRGRRETADLRALVVELRQTVIQQASQSQSQNVVINYGGSGLPSLPETGAAGLKLKTGELLLSGPPAPTPAAHATPPAESQEPEKSPKKSQ